jgi:hypothetical protein
MFNHDNQLFVMCIWAGCCVTKERVRIIWLDVFSSLYNSLLHLTNNYHTFNPTSMWMHSKSGAAKCLASYRKQQAMGLKNTLTLHILP